MSLPSEILDYIVDPLHNEHQTLQNCCLVAKSWIPRTRKYLFADIRFPSPGALKSWKKMLPDPSNSPAYYARILSVGCPQVAAVADAKKYGWIQTFSRVMHLDVECHTCNIDDSEISLAPFHGISPVLKSLRVISALLPHSQIFGLVRSLPLLEDLTLIISGITNHGGLDFCSPLTVTPLPNALPFTGSLELHLLHGMGSAARRLLDLPNGLHFQNLTLSWSQEDDIRWINALVAECSGTLENLHITFHMFGSPTLLPIDLSTATSLKYVDFGGGRPTTRWIIAALQTITSKHIYLRKISIYVSYDLYTHGPGTDIRQTVGETAYGQWVDLDLLLVQLWESHSIRPTITHTWAGNQKKEAVDYISCLLPEITKRGIIDLVEHSIVVDEVVELWP